AQASCRLKLAMITVWDRSARTTGDLGGISPRTYNLFPVDPTAAVGVGPFTVTLRGNAGVTLGAGAMVVLPTTTPEVRLVGSANTAVVTRASVAVGVSGFNAGVELQGRFAETRLTASLVANVLSGLSGSVSLTVPGITLKLIALLEALWVRVYSTTLTGWGAGGYGGHLLGGWPRAPEVAGCRLRPRSPRVVRRHASRGAAAAAGESRGTMAPRDVALGPERCDPRAVRLIRPSSPGADATPRAAAPLSEERTQLRS